MNTNSKSRKKKKHEVRKGDGAIYTPLIVSFGRRAITLTSMLLLF
jgi:hypothetical protein